MIGQSSYYGFIIVCLRLFIYKNYDFFMKKIISPSNYYNESQYVGMFNIYGGKILYYYYAVVATYGVCLSFTKIIKVML